MWKTFCALALLNSVCTHAESINRQDLMGQLPSDMVLAAPYTPFSATAGFPLNLSTVPALAAHASESGVSTVWIAGSMGQFDSMTVAERKSLAAAWVTANKALDRPMYTIVNVGTTVQVDAIELAKHAAEIGADAIAAVPPYYATASNVQGVLGFLQPIAAAAPSTPFFYYHIPGLTRTQISVAELFRVAQTPDYAVPTMSGVKYVDTNMTDWLELVTNYNDTHALLFAPEPKMQSFAIGLGRGAVLAEDFFGPTYIRMRAAYRRGDETNARKEQLWKLLGSSTFDQFGGTGAKRVAYQWMCDTDIGPPRPPVTPMDPANHAALKDALTSIDFFNKAKLNPTH